MPTAGDADAPSSDLGPAAGLGEGLAFPLAASPLAIGVFAPGAGDSAEPPRPPTWIVTFFELGVSVPWPSLSLILGWAGSGTAA